jgi:hypothetical protein
LGENVVNFRRIITITTTFWYLPPEMLFLQNFQILFQLIQLIVSFLIFSAVLYEIRYWLNFVFLTSVKPGACLNKHISADINLLPIVISIFHTSLPYDNTYLTSAFYRDGCLLGYSAV